MDPQRWDRIQALFHELLERPDAERTTALEGLRATDPDLAADVERLLEADARDGFILERDRFGVARDLLDGSVPSFHSIGPYRVLEVLGHGGMGVVYLAEREEPRSLVAIKVLRDASLSPHRRIRFAREQRTLAQLNHPSIAHFYDAGVLPDGTPFFVMEYVRGTEITEYCRERDLPVRTRLRLFREVCEAVAHANRLAVVHRDLKPSNVLVAEDSTTGSPRVKLLDFGIAKQIDALDATDPQTRTVFRLLTPAYASPEQLRGEPVGVQADVYALGVILYELLTGSHPYRLQGLGAAAVEALVSAGAVEPPSVRVRRAGGGSGGARSGRRASDPPAGEGAAWPELDVLCLKAMHPDVARRYASVEALLRDLDHLDRHEPLEARPDTLGYRTRKFVRRNRTWVATASATAATVALLVGFYTARLTDARDAALAEAARSENIQRFMLRLFDGGGGTAGPPDSLRVLTLLDRGVLEAASLDQDPLVQVELYRTLGGLYREMGQLSRADTLLLRALELSRSRFGSDSPEAARVLVALGDLRAAEARLPEAEALAREGLAIARAALPPRHPAIAESLAGLGRVLQARGEYDASIEVLEESARLRRAGAPGVDLAQSLSGLAGSHFLAGHYPAADSINLDLIELNRGLYGPRHPSIGDALMNLAAARFQAGQYAAAEGRYREALDLFADYYGDAHPQTASAMLGLGQSLTFQERYDEALGYLRPALAIRERVFGPDHPRVANVVNELGTVALMTDDLETAAAQYRRMVGIYRAAYDDRHYLIGVALSNLATTLLNAGRYTEAEPIFREAVDRFLDTLPPEHSHTAIARIKLGRTLVRQGRHAEAREPLLAGHDALTALPEPPANWLRHGRSDLAAVYEALGDAERAREFAALLAAMER